MALLVAFTKSPRCRLSFSEWAFVYGSSTPMRSAGTPPSSLLNGSTKGMEPPQPMVTGSVPYPSRSALSAALNAGASVLVYHQLPAPSLWTCTLTPQGGSLVSASVRRFSTSFGSMSGTVRRPTRAQALSTMMLRASLRELAWIALTASEGCRQFISHGGG